MCGKFKIIGAILNRRQDICPSGCSVAGQTPPNPNPNVTNYSKGSLVRKFRINGPQMGKTEQ